MLQVEDAGEKPNPTSSNHSARDSPTYSFNYDNEEFYPDTEEEVPATAVVPPTATKSLKEDELLMFDQDEEEELEDEQERQQRMLEKTIFHKAMIGIGPYLVEKAASVLEASRSFSGDLSYLPGKTTKSGKESRSTRNEPRGTTHRAKVSSSRSQSLTKGFQKLRLGGSSGPARGKGSRDTPTFRKGTVGPKKANNKSSSTSSLGRKLPPPKYTENTVSQRLHSARRGMIKELKSKITELEIQLRESQKENQILLRLQHRHEIALSKYEGAEAELPKLIQSHVAEVRTLHENLKKAQSHNRNVDEKIKTRDQKILRLEEENRTLVTLVKQNNLEERSKLAEQLDKSRNDQNVAENKVQDLRRHIEFLEKNHRHQIGVEKKKLRTTNQKLFGAHQELERVYVMLKEKERMLVYIKSHQGQMPPSFFDKETGLPSSFFQDDNASLRSSRTLPAKMRRAPRQAEGDLLEEEKLRRQRSETFEARGRNGNNHTPTNNGSAHNYPSQSHFVTHKPSQSFSQHYASGGMASQKQAQHNRHAINGNQYKTQPSAGAHTTSGRSEEEDQQMGYDLEDSSPATVQGGGDSPQLQDTARTEMSEQLDENYGNEEDEYYNFENVSVEDDTNYHPHKSLFMDAMDSSCNVSSGPGPSPLDTMRSKDPLAVQFNRRLRPSSAGPKFQLPVVKRHHGLGGGTKEVVTPQGKKEVFVSSRIVATKKGEVPERPCSSQERGESVDIDQDKPVVVQEERTVKKGSQQNLGGGDAPFFSSNPPTTMNATGDGGHPVEEHHFVAQRTSTSHTEMRPQQPQTPLTGRSTSATESAESSPGGSGPNSGRSFGSDLLRQQHFMSTNYDNEPKKISPRKAEMSSEDIESMFQKWRRCQSSTRLDDGEDGPVQERLEETCTPRSKDRLLQKLKELNQHKKLDDIVPLTNPAYFSPESHNNSSGNDCTNSPRQASTFKTAYQPFFNSGVSQDNANTAANLVVPKGLAPAKLNAPWLSGGGGDLVSQVEEEKLGGNGGESKIGIKSQHSSILEPRHNLLPSTPTPSKIGQVEENRMEQDLPRKKFSIGQITKDSGATITMVSQGSPKKGGASLGKNNKGGGAPSWR